MATLEQYKWANISVVIQDRLEKAKVFQSSFKEIIAESFPNPVEVRHVMHSKIKINQN
jgi:hypothetical protein